MQAFTALRQTMEISAVPSVASPHCVSAWAMATVALDGLCFEDSAAGDETEAHVSGTHQGAPVADHGAHDGRPSQGFAVARVDAFASDHIHAFLVKAPMAEAISGRIGLDA
jgi:hypothetical protein